LDIRANRALNAVLARELSEMFDYVELQYFHKLPHKEVLEMLATRFNQVIALADLSQEVKRYCYYRGLDEADDPRIIAFRRALENNSARIGAQELPTEKGSVEPTIKSWLQDFSAAIAASQNRSTYNVAHYITSNPHLANLSAADKQYLTEALQLYTWLFNPVVTAEEIEAYENQRTITPPISLQVGLGSAPESSVVEDVRELPEATNEQKRIMQDITAKAPQGVRYNNEGAEIRNLIKHVPNQPRGLMLNQETNIKLDEETQRMEESRQPVAPDIQSKLAELRKRHNNDA